MTFPVAQSEPARTPRVDPLIADARQRARRRRAWSVALVFASLALAAGLFFLVHTGSRRAPGPSAILRRWWLDDPFGGIRRPPGGAELRHEHELLARSTAFGQLSIWAAPSYAAPARCTWLKVGAAVWGGMCRRYQPPGRGLLDVVPLSLPINGRRSLNLLWGQVGTAVATLTVRFQNESEISLPLSKLKRPAPNQLSGVALQRVFLYPVPSYHWAVGRRPALLIARDTRGRIVGKPLRFQYTVTGLPESIYRARASARPSRWPVERSP